MRRLTLLTAGVLGLWLLLALPGVRIWGEGALVCSAIAAVLCLVPAAITLVWTTSSLGRSADQQLILMLGGTGVRMFVVLAVYTYQEQPAALLALVLIAAAAFAAEWAYRRWTGRTLKDHA